MNDPKYVSGLNDLHDLLVDSRKGYTEAADRAEDPAVKGMLRRFSQSRDTLISELVGERKAHTASYEPSNGTLKGDVHRVWMDVRDALSTTENANVLSECERGENYLLDRYEAVLGEQDLPSGLRARLADQQNQIRANVDAVRSLRHQKENVE